MEQLSSLSLEKHAGPYEQWPLLSRLYSDGVDTGTSVPGYVIEAQYKCKEGYLVITSHDCPFEESSDFVLLNEHFETTATEELLVPYASFLIQNHWPVSESTLRIHYLDDLFFDLHIESPLDVPSPESRSIKRIWTRCVRSIALRLSQSAGGKAAMSRHWAPSARRWLRLEKFAAFRDDPACLASIKNVNERLEKIGEQTSHTG